MSTAQQPGAMEVAPIEDSSLLAFYRDMNKPERRTFWACFAGWSLDGMDFMIYPLVIGTIITMWKVDPGTAGLAGRQTFNAPQHHTFGQFRSRQGGKQHRTRAQCVLALWGDPGLATGGADIKRGGSHIDLSTRANRESARGGLPRHPVAEHPVRP